MEAVDTTKGEAIWTKAKGQWELDKAKLRTQKEKHKNALQPVAKAWIELDNWLGENGQLFR